MNKEKMTVHKALSELKVLDDRIEKAIRSVSYTKAKKASATKVDGQDISEWEESVKSTYNKVIDLIERRNALKKAVVLSNATTTVMIGNKEYTVAEAIEMKNHGQTYYSLLSETIAESYNMSVSRVNHENEIEMDSRVEKFLSSMFSNKERSESSEVNKVREDFIKANSYELCDPISAKAKVTMLNDNVNSFMTEVDSALSVSNAITEIEIEY